MLASIKFQIHTKLNIVHWILGISFIIRLSVVHRQELISDQLVLMQQGYTALNIMTRNIYNEKANFCTK